MSMARNSNHCRICKKHIHSYRPQQELREGNVLTDVCLSFCPQVGGEVVVSPGMQWGREGCTLDCVCPRVSAQGVSTWGLAGGGVVYHIHFLG